MSAVLARRWSGVILVVIALDQMTKAYFHNQFAPGERVNVLPFFDWVLTYNLGAAFSFLASAGGWQRWFFVALALIVSAWCWRWLRRETDPRVQLALALIIGGALGNVIDRIRSDLGVVDFIDIYVSRSNISSYVFRECDRIL